MTERLIKPQSSRIPWRHYDELRAGIVDACARGRHPVEYLATRFPLARIDELDRHMKWLVRRWPEKRRALIESGEFRPAGSDPAPEPD